MLKTGKSGSLLIRNVVFMYIENVKFQEASFNSK